MNQMKESTMKHTVGPWTVSGRHFGYEAPQFRAETIEPNICEMSSSLSPEEVLGNARLIAAAQAMYEALQAILKECDDPTNSYHISHAVFTQADHALAQAEGQAS